MASVLPFETHLVSRATFGWTPAVEQDVLAQGWQAWLDDQLDPQQVGDAAMTAPPGGV